jgi:hypothetical protein
VQRQAVKFDIKLKDGFFNEREDRGLIRYPPFFISCPEGAALHTPAKIFKIRVS